MGRQGRYKFNTVRVLVKIGTIGPCARTLELPLLKGQMFFLFFCFVSGGRSLICFSPLFQRRKFWTAGTRTVFVPRKWFVYSSFYSMFIRSDRGEVCDPPCSAGRVACMQMFDPS